MFDVEGNAYFVEFCSHCLGEWLPPSSKMVADPSETIEPHDIVTIAIKLDDPSCPWAELINAHGEGALGICKIYLGSYEAPAGKVHIVGQLVPPCVALIPETAILAMHKIISIFGCTDMTERDRMSFALIRPFTGKSVQVPINPPLSELEAA